MVTYNTKSRNLGKRKIIKLLTLKDGRLSALFYCSIEIYSKEKIDTNIIIDYPFQKLEAFIQLNNGNLLICHGLAIDIICLTDNSYHIEQTNNINNISLKIIENKNHLFSFGSDKIII